MEAFEKIEEEQPDCVLLDMKMAGIDGIEVLKKIKKDWPEVPVIMMTAYGELENNRRSAGARCRKIFSQNLLIFMKFAIL